MDTVDAVICTQTAKLLAAAQVPKTRARDRGNRYAREPIGLRRYLCEALYAPLHAVSHVEKTLTGTQVPKPHGLIAAAGQRFCTVGGKEYGADGTRVPLHHTQTFPCSDIPEAQAHIARSRQRMGAVGGQGDRPDRIGVTFKHPK